MISALQSCIWLEYQDLKVNNLEIVSQSDQPTKWDSEMANDWV